MIGLNGANHATAAAAPSETRTRPRLAGLRSPVNQSNAAATTATTTIATLCHRLHLWFMRGAPKQAIPPYSDCRKTTRIEQSSVVVAGDPHVSILAR